MSKEVVSFIPLSARNFYSRAMGHLYFDLSQTERQQPFSDRCSRMVQIEETVTLPYECAQLHYPMVDGIADPAASFGCGFQMEGRQLRFGESLLFGKRRYEAADWMPFRACVLNQIKLSETPVVLTK